MPAPDEAAKVIAQALESQRDQHQLLVGFHERKDAPHPQEVRSRQEENVEHMALDLLPVEQQFAQLLRLGGRFDPGPALQGVQRGGGMAARADAADATCQVGGFVPSATPKHRFEEAGRFDDLEAEIRDLTLSGADHDVAVAFDAGEMVNIQVDIGHVGVSLFRAGRRDGLHSRAGATRRFLP